MVFSSYFKLDNSFKLYSEINERTSAQKLAFILFVREGYKTEKTLIIIKAVGNFTAY